MAWVINSAGKIICHGTNWNHRSGKKQWGHAERVVQYKLSKITKNNRIYKKHQQLYIIVIRVMKNGTLGNSRPCSKCMASFGTNIKKVIYSTGDSSSPFDFIDL
jgi:hypothetical protein